MLEARWEDRLAFILKIAVKGQPDGSLSSAVVRDSCSTLLGMVLILPHGYGSITSVCTWRWHEGQSAVAGPPVT